MNVSDLIGFTLESCSFSKSSYIFELSGHIEDNYKTFNLGTSYNLSQPKDVLSDLGGEFSSVAWEFLETKLVSITLNNNRKFPTVVIEFQEGRQLVVFSESELVDNLLLLVDKNSGDWFPFF